MTTATKTEKPILFSTELVQAILAGRKTQTRRIVKTNEKGFVCRDGTCLELHEKHGLVWKPYGGSPLRKYPDPEEYCPYGYPGQELWVRETFSFLGKHDNKTPSEIYDNQILYKAGKNITNQFGLGTNIHESDFGRWRPSIHMPRRYSRIQLTVEDVRVERVQEITPRDIIDEGIGIKEWDSADVLMAKWESLWDSINADRKGGKYSWESNPWCWVINFNVKSVNQ